MAWILILVSEMLQDSSAERDARELREVASFFGMDGKDGASYISEGLDAARMFIDSCPRRPGHAEFLVYIFNILRF